MPVSTSPSTSTSTSNLFPPRPPLTPQTLTTNLSHALSAQIAGTQNSKRPFAAILLGPNQTTILLRHFSLSHYQHAESELCRLAAAQFAPEYLWQCTVYSTWEPCAMCAATLYWANVGTLVYAASEGALREVVGEGNEENFTLDLGCRVVLRAGQKDVRVVGPFDGTGKEGGDEGGGGGGHGISEDWQGRVCEQAWISYWRKQRGLDGVEWAEFAKEKLK